MPFPFFAPQPEPLTPEQIAFRQGRRQAFQTFRQGRRELRQQRKSGELAPQDFRQQLADLLQQRRSTVGQLREARRIAQTQNAPPGVPPTFEQIVGPDITPVAQFTPLEIEAQGRQAQFARDLIPQILGQLQGLGQFQEQAFQPIFDLSSFLTSPERLDVTKDPLTQGLIQASIDPIKKQLFEEIFPQIRSQAISSGTLGGTRPELAAGLASSRFADTASNLTSQILEQQRAAATQNAVTGAQLRQGAISDILGGQSGLLQSLLAIGQQPGQILGGIGQAQRGLTQQNLDEVQRRLQELRNTPGDLIDQFLRRVGSTNVPPSSTQNSTSVLPGEGGNPLSSALGGAIGGGTLASVLGLAGPSLTSLLGLGAGTVAGGAAGGAAAGAASGSIVPGIGNIIGALLGLGLGLATS